MDHVQNPELDKIQNGQNPEWTKHRVGQNPEIDNDRHISAETDS